MASDVGTLQAERIQAAAQEAGIIIERIGSIGQCRAPEAYQIDGVDAVPRRQRLYVADPGICGGGEAMDQQQRAALLPGPEVDDRVAVNVYGMLLDCATPN